MTIEYLTSFGVDDISGVSITCQSWGRGAVAAIRETSALSKPRTSCAAGCSGRTRTTPPCRGRDQGPCGRECAVQALSLGESLDSGIDLDDRRDFAVDLDNLTLRDDYLVNPELYAGDWAPPRHGARFAQTVIDVKRRWGLSVDPAERDARERLLRVSSERELSCVTPTRLTLKPPSIPPSSSRGPDSPPR